MKRKEIAQYASDFLHDAYGIDYPIKIREMYFHKEDARVVHHFVKGRPFR